GEFGSVVLLPTTTPKFPARDEWAVKNFEDVGIDLAEITEQGQRRGLQNGDILIAMNGEKFPDDKAFRQAIEKDVKEGSEVTFTVKRGNAQVQIKATITKGASWINYDLGVRRYYEFPSDWTKYQKGGHHDARW